MTEDADEEDADDDGGVWAGVTFFIFGLVVPILFRGMTQGQDMVSFLLIFGGFAACVVFGEFYLTVSSGVAFGAGLVMTSLLGFDWWFASLAVAATILNLARYAQSSQAPLDLDGEGDPLDPQDPNGYT